MTRPVGHFLSDFVATVGVYSTERVCVGVLPDQRRWFLDSPVTKPLRKLAGRVHANTVWRGQIASHRELRRMCVLPMRAGDPAFVGLCRAYEQPPPFPPGRAAEAARWRSQVQSPSARSSTVIGNRFFAVLHQKGIEVRIGIADGCVFERLSIRDLIDVASEYDLAAKERLKPSWQVGATMYEFDGDWRYMTIGELPANAKECDDEEFDLMPII